MRPATSLSISAWDRTRMPSRRTSPSCSSSSLPTNVERSIFPLAIASSFRLSSLVGLTAGRMCDGRFFFTRRRLLDFHHVRGHYPSLKHHHIRIGYDIKRRPPAWTEPSPADAVRVLPPTLRVLPSAGSSEDERPLGAGSAPYVRLAAFHGGRLRTIELLGPAYSR